MANAYCLNQKSDHSVANCLKSGLRSASELYLESDCDEQLLISFPFLESVKLNSIAIRGPADGTWVGFVCVYVSVSVGAGTKLQYSNAVQGGA